MNFTVLGASGFVGRHLCAALRQAGHEVFAPGRDDPAVYEHPLGHVIYCIGLTADFRSRPFDTVRAHVGVLAEVLERARFESLLYLSSTRVYARSAVATEDSELPVTSAGPADIYALSKLTGEALCRCCGRDNVRVARLSNVVGPDLGSENFLFAVIREALAGRIVLRTNPASAKDYVHIDDVVDLLPRLATEGRHWIYNLARGLNVSHREITDRISGLTGCAVDVLPDAPLQAFPRIDIGRLTTEFAFTPRPVLDVLPDLIAQFRQQVSRE